MSFWYVPAGHGAHSAAFFVGSSAATYSSPAAHTGCGVQLVGSSSMLERYVPSGHFWHSRFVVVLPSGPKVPAGHTGCGSHSVYRCWVSSRNLPRDGVVANIVDLAHGATHFARRRAPQLCAQGATPPGQVRLRSATHVCGVQSMHRTSCSVLMFVARCPGPQVDSWVHPRWFTPACGCRAAYASQNGPGERGTGQTHTSRMARQSR